MSQLIILCILCFISLPVFASERSAFKRCGGVTFGVTELQADTGSFQYSLFARKPGSVGDVVLYVHRVNGLFYAACVTTEDKKQYILFQAYFRRETNDPPACQMYFPREDSGISASDTDPDYRYGIVDPATMNVLQVPELSDCDSARNAYDELGVSIEYLPSSRDKFCCERKEN